MDQITLTINGREYVAVPRDEFERIKPSGNVDALTYSQQSLGGKLKAARKEAGLTQVQLAKLLKISQGMVAGVELGSTSISGKYVARVLKACKLADDWAPKR
jgi:DNA-binding XRE family transcriptional regulator